MSGQTSEPPPSLRPLLPAPIAPDREEPERPLRHFEFKKKRQPAACEPCREHKTKCDGLRPQCLACVRRGSGCRFEAQPKETHTQALKRKYESLQDESSALQHMFELLRTRPENEALSIFRRIREGDTPEDVMQHVRHGDLLMQLSSTWTSDARHRSKSSSTKHVSMSSSEAEDPHFDSHINKSPSASVSATETIEDGTRLTRAVTSLTTANLQQYEGCEVVEPLIQEVRPSQWTTVAVEDGVMRTLLAIFFLLEYRRFSIFHKDYFLQDMASGNQDHCSPLLVNTVLACACHVSREGKSRDRYWSLPESSGRLFFAEANRLWALETSEQNRGKDRLTTVQAGFLLSIIHGIDSISTIGWQCTTRAVEMAKALGLFEMLIEEVDNSNVHHARLYTAWSVFCWQSHWCYQLYIPPLIDRPPSNPLPDPYQNPEWYGEIRVSYPPAERISSTGHGHLFKAKAEFLTTLNSISRGLFVAKAESPVLMVLDVKRDQTMTG